MDESVCVCVYFYNSLQVIIYTFNYEKGVQSTDMIYILSKKTIYLKLTIFETSSEMKKI